MKKIKNIVKGEFRMKKSKSLVKAVSLLILVISIFTGCSNGDNNGQTGTDVGEVNNTLKGSMTIAGSTSMEKLANASAEAFMIKYPNVVVQAEFVGSSAGVEQLLSGTVDIGNASRALKESEVSSGAVENIVAIDGIAVILDKNNAVENITKEQLVGIYTGTISNWSELGGQNQPIVVVGREAGSGTRGAFEEILKIEETSKYANEINSTGGVMAKVASTPGAIGYVSIDIIDNTVKAAKLEDVAPTVEDIKSGNYFLSRPFVMATKGEIDTQNEIVKAYFEFMKSDAGKEVIQGVGLILAE